MPPRKLRLKELKDLMDPKPTPAKLREDLRKQYKIRLRRRRAELFDSHRRMGRGDISDVNTFVASAMMEEIGQQQGSSQNELLEILEEIYDEELTLELEHYEQQEQREIDGIVNNLFICRLCDKICPPQQEVCDSCAISKCYG